MAPGAQHGLPLIVESLDFAFGDAEAVLEGLSMEVPAGTVLSLLGPSGCGKTTLLRVVVGLELPSAGTVSIGDRLLTAPGVEVPPERRRIGMVFQDWALFPHLDVASNIAFGLPRARRRDPAAVAPTLELVGLEGMGSRMPEQLSGGQQQRVALGRALAQEPDVLLLDEPFSNLDASLRARVRSDVHALLGEIGVTTVMVTHDRDEAFVLGDAVALMRRGRIVQTGTPAEVYEHPADEWCARFVGEANLVAVDAGGAMADTPLGTLLLDSEVRGTAVVVVRPEELSIVAGREPDLEPPAAAPGIVSLVEYQGPRTHYLVDVDGSTFRVESSGPPVCSVGDPVEVAVADKRFPAFAR